jgi:hypothetical protein
LENTFHLGARLPTAIGVIQLRFVAVGDEWLTGAVQTLSVMSRHATLEREDDHDVRNQSLRS